MNEDQLAAWEALKEKINSSSNGGVHGERVKELKELAAAFDETVNPPEEEGQV